MKLPLWRLIAGVAILGSFVAVMTMLAPVYIDNFKLRSYVKTLTDAPDDTLRAEVLDRARQLDLPVLPGDIQITRDQGKPRVNMRYKVKMNLAIYQVDLHL